MKKKKLTQKKIRGTWIARKGALGHEWIFALEIINKNIIISKFTITIVNHKATSEALMN